MDPTYRTVVPLPDDEYPQDASHIRVVSAILSSIILAFIRISFVESKRWNSTVPTALTIGAASCVFAEAVNCYLANVWWTASHDPNQLMFTLLGREFDLYVGIVWWSFGAVMSGIIYGALARNVRTGTLWALLSMCAFWDFVIEECMLNYGGLYTYYGHQPLVLFKLFPCWWMFGNVSGIFFGIAITYRYQAWFNGWRSGFLLPILPFCYVGPQVLAGMPTMYVVNGDYSPLLRNCVAFSRAALVVCKWVL